jgi:hypothetical protein
MADGNQDMSKLPSSHCRHQPNNNEDDSDDK